MKRHTRLVPGFDRGMPGMPPYFVVEDDADEDLIRHDPPWTKQSHPYCYDPLTIWGDPRPNKECNGTVYTHKGERR